VVTVDESDVLEEVDIFHDPNVETLPEPVYDGNPDTDVGLVRDDPVLGGPVGGTRPVSFDGTA
jgi:hypothetical protein